MWPFTNFYNVVWFIRELYILNVRHIIWLGSCYQDLNFFTCTKIGIKFLLENWLPILCVFASLISNVHLNNFLLVFSRFEQLRIIFLLLDFVLWLIWFHLLLSPLSGGKWNFFVVGITQLWSGIIELLVRSSKWTVTSTIIVWNSFKNIELLLNIEILSWLIFLVSPVWVLGSWPLPWCLLSSSRPLSLEFIKPSPGWLIYFLISFLLLFRLVSITNLW